MVFTVYLTIVGICFAIICHGAQLSLDDKITNLQDSLYRRPIMSLNTEKFKQYVSASPRNYSIIAMFTALSPRMNCQVCKPAHDEFEIVANSYRHQYSEAKKLYFVMVDYEHAPEIFSSINLNTAPAFFHFPAKGFRKSADTMDVQISGFEADVIAKFVKERTEIPITIVRPPNYGAPIMILLFLLMIVSILYIRRDNLDFLYNRSAWGAFCLFLVFAFMSGQMWNHIRGPPFAINNPKTGSATFIHTSTQYQLVSETYIIGALYAVVTIGFILLNDAAVDDNIENPKPSPVLKRNIVVVIGLIVTVVGFSLLLSVFRSKHRGIYCWSITFNMRWMVFLLVPFLIAIVNSSYFDEYNNDDIRETLGEDPHPTKPDTFASICMNSTGGVYLARRRICERQIALGSYKNAVNATGWGFLEIETFPGYSYEMQSYAAGYLEGVLTKLQIYYHYRNTIEGMCKNYRKYCRQLWDYLTENLDWIRTQAKEKSSTDKYWRHVNLTFTQLTGIYDGYIGRDAKELEANVRYDLTPILMIQLSGELFDLNKYFKKQPDPVRDDPDPGKCSGFLKVTEGNKDLLFSHVAMSSYSTMNRVMKLYKFAFDSKEVPGHTVSFSGYAGALSSADDYSLMSSGLAAIETTIAVFNETLYTSEFIKTKGQIHCWVRSFVANALASTAKEWTDIFALYNSGTYNNQWTVVAYKEFKPNQDLPKENLLWVLEQIPGYTMAKDMTWFLNKYKYWASYNIPYFHEISIRSKFNEKGKENNWWKWGASPRAKIFHRDQGKVKDLETLKNLMRYNDYKHEKFSRCSCTPPYTAEAAISARGDLNPINGTYEVEGMGHRNHGSLDYKGTNYELFKKLQIHVIGGPTWGNVPPFDWRTTDIVSPHYGQPDLWKFEPVITEWDTQVDVNL